MGYYGEDFRPYVSQAERKVLAKDHAKKLKKAGHTCCPVELTGKQIAQTFWGQAWCTNLEAYSDYENRLPRGRTYVRNGSVYDLQVKKGRVEARVCGSDLYEIAIEVKPVTKARWSKMVEQCAGQVGTVVELLKGKLDKSVMEVLCRRPDGLFPSPAEISLECSCPDWADMCKHVAAALYGVGARLDQDPDLLFLLRGVDKMDLVGEASGAALTRPSPRARTLEQDQLADVFGIELEPAAAAPKPRKQAAAGKKKAAAKKKPAVRKKAAARSKR